MNSHRLLRGLGIAAVMVAAAACQGTDDNVSEFQDKDGVDIQAYLDALPGARVIDVDSSGIPSFVTGALGVVDVKSDAHDVALDAIVAAVAPVFRASPTELVLRSAKTDNIGDQHFRFRQIKNGLDVIGGEIVIHVRDGVAYAANGSARDDLAAAVAPKIDASSAIDAARLDSASILSLAASDETRLAYRLSADRLDLVYVVEVTGVREDQTPVRDEVLVSAIDGSIIDRVAHIHTAKNREVHNLNGGTSLPGPIARIEGQAPVADAIVNKNYDLLGVTYDCYSTLFGRDSINGAGAKLISSVHYGNNYVNAYWNSTQMVYGDGDGVTASSLAASMDVTGHELTHAVTENESNLTYSGESGGLNESMSDIFGNVCEWFRDGRVVSANTWIVGEDCWTPATPGDGLRYMNDPVKDGSSKDYWTSGVGGVDVHYSSGISNLAFYLLAQGGLHPRGKSTVNVTGIGIEKAAQIFYRANANILGPSSNFAAAKTATEQAAAQLGYTAAEQASVSAAWLAVGVGAPVVPPTVIPLSNGVPVSNISDAASGQKYYSLVVPSGSSSLTFTTAGGTGDVDLYTNVGAIPTLSTYTCRPYASGNAETCTVNNPAAGTYYVLLNAFSAYSGVTLTGTYGGVPSNVLTNGVPVSNISGAAASSQVWTLAVPAGKASLTFTISGGTGDADLYVNPGSAPTDTVYVCRPYLGGNAETCTITNPAAGTWYARVKGYSAFTGVSLKGQYP